MEEQCLLFQNRNLNIMKELTFNFDHPVRARAYFMPVNCCGGVAHSCDISSNGLQPLIIPVGHLNNGDWKLELDWVSDSRMFSVAREFNVGDTEQI